MLYDWLMLCAVQIIIFLTLCLGFGKVGFCEMFAKRGTLQRVEVRS